MYGKGTSIRHLKALQWKSCGSLLSELMICNYTVCCWPTTSSNILIVDHISAKVGFKYIDCIVLSAENWYTKDVLSQERERFMKDANVEKMAKSNISILGSKSSPIMHVGSEASSIVRGMLKTFARNFNNKKNPTEQKKTPANNWQTPAHVWQTFGA